MGIGSQNSLDHPLFCCRTTVSFPVKCVIICLFAAIICYQINCCTFCSKPKFVQTIVLLGKILIHFFVLQTFSVFFVCLHFWQLNLEYFLRRCLDEPQPTVKHCQMNWSLSSLIWSIRIVCERG